MEFFIIMKQDSSEHPTRESFHHESTCAIVPAGL